jgi:type IV fimbrial biogenesis protein FimT
MTPARLPIVRSSQNEVSVQKQLWNSSYEPHSSVNLTIVKMMQTYFSNRPSNVVGISIVELVVSLAIVSILAATGVPAYSSFIQSNQLSESAFDVLGTINLARTEAVKRRTRVVLCRSADPTLTTPSCGGNANTWTTGWLVFASGDTNNTYQAGTDTLLGIGLVDSPNVTVITNSTSDSNLEYNSDGTTNEGGGTARFAVCDKRGGAYGRQVNVPPHGRPKFVKGDSASPINCSSPS